MSQMQSGAMGGGMKKTNEQTNKILASRRDRLVKNEQKYSQIEVKMT